MAGVVGEGGMMRCLGAVGGADWGTPPGGLQLQVPQVCGVPAALAEEAGVAGGHGVLPMTCGLRCHLQFQPARVALTGGACCRRWFVERRTWRGNCSGAPPRVGAVAEGPKLDV